MLGKYTNLNGLIFTIKMNKLTVWVERYFPHYPEDKIPSIQVHAALGMRCPWA
jgi:hypothetical protein